MWFFPFSPPQGEIACGFIFFLYALLCIIFSKGKVKEVGFALEMEGGDILVFIDSVVCATINPEKALFPAQINFACMEVSLIVPDGKCCQAWSSSQSFR